MMNNKRGFTLIELLVVMTILGLLAGISLFALGGARESARDGRRKSDLEAVRSALELYKADCNEYPSSVTFGGQLKGDGSTGCPSTNIYMDEVPDDPISSRNYTYTSSSPYVSYTLCAPLEDVTAADTDCSASCGSGVNCSYHVDNP